ncbi:glycosyl hydrolase family 18 protein [Burkholderia pseudomallei]|uniref:glycosyl hydrolase family 18 protein n=1 Tax=Burkholderia pseudomallei TaxID=28450 RepID=UPI000A1CB051|nr:glycosyl hydrolase family 18 protein [Burkholderia pseudomallei]
MKKLSRPRAPFATTSGRAQTLAFATIAAASALCFANSALAAPGAPALKEYEINGYGKSYGFVHVDQIKAGSNEPYKNYVTLNKKVEVPLPFSIWSNGTATKAVALIDGVEDAASQIKLSPGTSQEGTVVAHPARPGKLKFQVRAYAADGSYTDSKPVQVTVFDTTPEFADDLPNNVPANFKKFSNKSGSVVGTYFATWSVYDRAFDMSQVPVEQLTHILYGFIPICGGDGINDSLKAQGNPYNQLQKSCQGLPDFSVAIHDSWGEVAKQLPGQTASSPLKGVMGQMLAAKKRNPDLKILPSIGGWTLSDPFFHLDNSANRKVFVNSVEQFLRTWKFFDGVDIDWEFPGGGGANPKLGKATDGATYVTLMKELRAMLDRLGAEYDKKYELTSAIGAGKDKIDRVDYKEAAKYMDYIFDMTYDYYGAWSMTDLGHQTALYSPKWRPDTNYTTDNSIKALLAQGVEPKKLVVGAAAYGRGWTGVSGYTDGNPFTGTAKGPHKGQWEPGILDYKKIKSEMLGANGGGINGYEYHYDQTAEAPYVFNKSTGDLVTFDDPRSVQAKGDYVRKHQLGGMFSWEIDADNGDVLNAMHAGLGHDEGSGSINKPPIADAGASQTVTGPQTVTLDASKSRDPEGDKLAYKWEQVDGKPLKIINPTSMKATVDIPAVERDTNFVFKLTVTDTSGLSASARTTVTAKADGITEPGENRPPVAHLTGPASAEAGQNVTLSAEKSSDPDGDALTFTWTVPSGIEAQKNGAILKFSAPKLSTDKTFQFRVKVSDGKLSSTATHSVLVKAAETGGGGNGSHPQYKEGTKYSAGDIVSNHGKLYQCKPFPYSGWCSGAASAYEPGKGFAWTDAWTFVSEGGGGSGGESGGSEGSGTHPTYKEGTQYAPGDIVSNGGKLYRCKPAPFGGWCSMAKWAYEPGKGSAWDQAWEEYSAK